MSQADEIQRRLLRLFSAEMNLDFLAPDTDLFATGVLDSLTFVDLLVHLEEEFSVSLSIDEIDVGSFQSIARIAQLLSERLRRAHRTEEVVGVESARWDG